MSPAALSAHLRRRWPRLAIALGLSTLTGRFTCIGVAPAGNGTRVTFIPADAAPGVSEASAVLHLANPAAPDLFTVGRPYFIDVTPDL